MKATYLCLTARAARHVAGDVGHLVISCLRCDDRTENKEQVVSTALLHSVPTAVGQVGYCPCPSAAALTSAFDLTDLEVEVRYLELATMRKPS